MDHTKESIPQDQNEMPLINEEFVRSGALFEFLIELSGIDRPQAPKD